MNKIYDYVFYSIYKNTSVTNKSIPEWSTIISISIIIAFNLFSILIFFDFDIKLIGEKGFGITPLMIIGLNYLYFLRNKRHLDILKEFEKIENNLIYDILILVYVCLSIFFLFSVLEANLKYPLILITAVILFSLIPYLMKTKKKQDD